MKDKKLIAKNGKHLPDKKKIKFVDFIIAICLIVCLYITIDTVQDYHRLDIPMPADVLHELFYIWGGELLLILLRQVLGSDVVGQFRGTKKYKRQSTRSGEYNNEDGESI